AWPRPFSWLNPKLWACVAKRARRQCSPVTLKLSDFDR
ncbi:hypothetical protein A2U01_0095792, partial [Trifolium medium]|nr:hypothetical protein [Trifolium medium]